MSVVFCSELKFFSSAETAPAEMHDAPGTKTRGAQGNTQGHKQCAKCLLPVENKWKKKPLTAKTALCLNGPSMEVFYLQVAFHRDKSCIHRYVLSWWKS